MEENDRAHERDVKKLGEMIRDVRIAMLTTVDEDGSLRSRPMATQKVEFDGDLWFFTDVNTAKTSEIEQDRHVNLSYASTEDNRYVSVSGLARVIRDRKKAEELWNPLYKAWFPNGLDDPNLGLLRVQVSKAEYWDSPSSTVVQLVGFVKAVATGKRYEPGDHEKLSL